MITTVAALRKTALTLQNILQKKAGKDITAALKQNTRDVHTEDIPKLKWKHKAKHYRSHGLSVLHLKPSGSCRLWANVHITYLLHPDIANLAVALIWKLNVFVLDLNASWALYFFVFLFVPPNWSLIKFYIYIFILWPTQCLSLSFFEQNPPYITSTTYPNTQHYTVIVEQGLWPSEALFSDRSAD